MHIFFCFSILFSLRLLNYFNRGSWTRRCVVPEDLGAGTAEREGLMVEVHLLVNYFVGVGRARRFVRHDLPLRGRGRRHRGELCRELLF